MPRSKQERSNLVDHRSSSRHQPIPHAMQGLQVELIVRLDRNEAHVLPIYSFSNRFGIEEVVLVGLHIRLHELSRDQLHVVALCS